MSRAGATERAVRDRRVAIRGVAGLAILPLLLLAPLPAVADSGYRSGPGFDAAAEIAGSLLALAVGLGLVVRFRAFGGRLLLFAGLAFLVAGAEDLAVGLVALRPLLDGVPPGAATAEAGLAPALSAGGRVAAALLLAAAPLLAGRPAAADRGRDAARWSVTAVLVALGGAGLAVALPLPVVRFEGLAVSRPLDLVAAATVLAASALLASLAIRLRDRFLWWLAASASFIAASLACLALSRAPHDAAHDLAHAWRALGYLSPLLGLLLAQVDEVRTARRAEHRATRDRDRLGEALAAAEAGLWDWNLERRRMRIGDPLRRMLAEPPGDDEVEEDWLLDRLHPDDRAEFIAAFARSAAEPEFLVDLEHRLRAGDGTWCWVHTTARVVERRPQAVAGGVPVDRAVRMAGQCVEITARRLVRDRERGLAQRLEEITDCVPGALYRCRMDAGGALTFDYFSPGVRDLYGLAPDDAVRASDLLFAFTHPDDVAGLLERIETSRERLRPFEAEYRVHRPDGRELLILARATPQRDPDGSTVWTGYMEDVTDRRRLEAATTRADTAEAANAAKTAFLAHMSHEIRTPLTGILGYLDMLEAECGGPGGRDRAADRSDHPLARVRANAELLLGVVDDVLDTSRIERGELAVQPQETALPGLVFETVDLVRHRAALKDLALLLTWSGPVPRLVRTDPLRLQQILGNLLRNAIKFTERGRVELRITHEPHHASGDAVRFDVIDTGIGIPRDRRQAIFEPFGQADESMHRRHGGSGLGLAISRGLARALGGDVTVTSRVGLGSTFTVRVARGSVSDPALVRPGEEPLPEPRGARSAPKTPAAPAAPARPLAGTRVLLVEDGPDNQRLIAALLRKAGAEVDVADHGGDGLEVATAALDAGRPHDLVLTDMQMPVMDGYTLAMRLRGRGFDRPIIAVTAHAMVGDRERCLDAGCVDYVSKPVRREELIGTCVRWLGEADEPGRRAA